jgi:PIN domain nuclease of toxin-antitoxin system
VRLLLDTHTAIWWLDAPEKLSKLGYGLISEPENEILISPVVPWEIAIKMNTGKLSPHELVSDFRRVIMEENFTAMEIGPLYTIRAGLLPLHHRDPFDRLLAAQSLELDIPLISADKIFDHYGVKRVW